MKTLHLKKQLLLTATLFAFALPINVLGQEDVPSGGGKCDGSTSYTQDVEGTDSPTVLCPQDPKETWTEDQAWSKCAQFLGNAAANGDIKDDNGNDVTFCKGCIGEAEGCEPNFDDNANADLIKVTRDDQDRRCWKCELKEGEIKLTCTECVVFLAVAVRVNPFLFTSANGSFIMDIANLEKANGLTAMITNLKTSVSHPIPLGNLQEGENRIQVSGELYGNGLHAITVFDGENMMDNVKFNIGGH